MSDDVRAVLDRYAEGTRTCDVEMLRGAFHPQATMSGWLGPDDLMGGPQPFLDAIAGNEVGPDYASEVAALEVDGPVATATLTERNLFGPDFVNHFHLTRQPDEAWLITAKLFRHG